MASTLAPLPALQRRLGPLGTPTGAYKRAARDAWSPHRAHTDVFSRGVFGLFPTRNKGLGPYRQFTASEASYVTEGDTNWAKWYGSVQSGPFNTGCCATDTYYHEAKCKHYPGSVDS